MFLGYDMKSSLYYFFLNERDKIFVNWRISWIENDYKWGYEILSYLVIMNLMIYNYY